MQDREKVTVEPGKPAAPATDKVTVEHEPATPAAPDKVTIEKPESGT